MILNKFVSKKCRCLEYRDPENKHAFLNGHNIKTQKHTQQKKGKTEQKDCAASGELNVTIVLM